MNLNEWLKIRPPNRESVDKHKVAMIKQTQQPQYGYCETCGWPLWELNCEHCGEVYD